MNNNEILAPDYLFEVSWEVCNKVGGIYTVLSTRAKTILTKTDAQLMFIGPDLWKETANPLFKEDKRLMDYDGLMQSIGHLL